MRHNLQKSPTCYTCFKLVLDTVIWRLDRAYKDQLRLWCRGLYFADWLAVHHSCCRFVYQVLHVLRANVEWVMKRRHRAAKEHWWKGTKRGGKWAWERRNSTKMGAHTPVQKPEHKNIVQCATEVSSLICLQSYSELLQDFSWSEDTVMTDLQTGKNWDTFWGMQGCRGGHKKQKYCVSPLSEINAAVIMI